MTFLISGDKYLVNNAGFVIGANIAAAQGFDDPSNWSRYIGNPVIPVGGAGTWDDYWIQPDSIIDVGDGTYRLYYSGGGTPGGYTDQVGYATSPDGTDWTKYGSNPIFSAGAGGQWDQGSVSHFIVLREGSSWYAWYGGHNTGGWEAGASKIGYATSADGISWSRYGSNPVLDVGAGGQWDSAFVIPSHVFKSGSTYYMYYWGGTGSPVWYDQTQWKVGLATSSDRVTWTKHGSNPLFAGDTGQWDDGVLEPFVIKNGSTFYMFYQGNTSDQNFSALGVATSSDGLSWSRSITNPFPRGSDTTWDDTWNEAPKLIKIGTVWHMYYMGQPGGGPMQIGLMQFN